MPISAALSTRRIIYDTMGACAKGWIPPGALSLSTFRPPETNQEYP
jgi:hypothetical protein